MKIKYCSLTGADDAVDIADLSALAADFPFVETAILLMPERMGQPRFPTAPWIRDFAAQYTGEHRAMHLCGEGLFGFLADDPAVLGLMRGFQRIQLNLTFADAGTRITPEALAAHARKYAAHQFIIQYGPQHGHYLPHFADVKNHALLFDDSAGRGIAPDRWPAPLPGHFCGYAGGLNPENLDRHLDLINDAAGDTLVWIDMESGIRTDDRYDIAKCRRVLEIASEYVD
jgi:phosphoribosylanthranilate isomerase